MYASAYSIAILPVWMKVPDIFIQSKLWNRFKNTRVGLIKFRTYILRGTVYHFHTIG